MIEFSSRTRSKLLVVHDLRQPLPLEDAAADVVFAHLALCMALLTKEIHAVADEVRRVLRPGGVFIYTVRHTGDATTDRTRAAMAPHSPARGIWIPSGSTASQQQSMSPCWVASTNASQTMPLR